MLIAGPSKARGFMAIPFKKITKVLLPERLFENEFTTHETCNAALWIGPSVSPCRDSEDRFVGCIDRQVFKRALIGNVGGPEVPRFVSGLARARTGPVCLDRNLSRLSGSLRIEGYP
jgi:hypothetical protein